MSRRLTALAVLACVAAASGALPAGAGAAQSGPEKLFTKKLLKDERVAKSIKKRLRNGAFVDRVSFVDLTGEGRTDAVVVVHSGGTAGRIAVYIFSSRDSTKLRIVYKNQSLYRAIVRVPRDSARRHQSIRYRVPIYDPGDELCCPGAHRETEIEWSSSRRRFVLAGRRTIEHVRPSYCSRTGDYCTSATKRKSDAILELRTFSFSGDYTLCVTAPDDKRTCHGFELARSGSVRRSRVRWSENFPDAGRGVYVVCWRVEGKRCLGPKLSFRRG